MSDKPGQSPKPEHGLLRPVTVRVEPRPGSTWEIAASEHSERAPHGGILVDETFAFFTEEHQERERVPVHVLREGYMKYHRVDVPEQMRHLLPAAASPVIHFPSRPGESDDADDIMWQAAANTWERNLTQVRTLNAELDEAIAALREG